MFDLDEATSELYSQLPDDSDVTEDEIADRLDDYRQMSIPRDEAVRSVRNSLEDVEEVDETDNQPTELTLDEINQDEQNVTVEAQVVSVYDDTHDAIKQKGRIADQTGDVGFVEFNGSEHQTLEEGESYRFENALTDEYQGNYSIKLLESAEVTQLDKDVEVDDSEDTLTAPIVSVSDSSGLIERCPEDDCTYTISEKACPDHGHMKGDGNDDLRIIASADTGNDVERVIIGTKMTEEILGMTLDEALEEAREEMDRSIINDYLEEELLGRYFFFRGISLDSFIVEEFEEVSGGEVEDRAEGLLERAANIEL